MTGIFYCGFAAHWKRSHNIVQKRHFTVSKRSLVDLFSVWSGQTRLLSSSAVGSRSRSHGIKYNFETSLFFFTCDSLNFSYQKLSQNCPKNKPVLYPFESVLGFLVGATAVALGMANVALVVLRPAEIRGQNRKTYYVIKIMSAFRVKWILKSWLALITRISKNWDRLVGKETNVTRTE